MPGAENRQQAIDWEKWEHQFDVPTQLTADEAGFDWGDVEEQFADTAPIPVTERCLTEVTNLNANRLPNGSFKPEAVKDLFKNLYSATQEAAMPYAVTTTRHEYRTTGERDESGRLKGTYWWLGKTAVEAAVTGKRYHVLPAALERVDVEIDEAHHAEENLRPGVAHILISPRMSRADASLKAARREHLGDDDSIRMSYVETDDEGNITNRVLQSLLVRDIPLEAWVNMLADPENIFGKAISVENPESALAVMKVHRQLELPVGDLPNGVMSVIEAVVQYVDDPKLKESLEYQLTRFHEDQTETNAQAESIAKRWQKFEIELANSLHEQQATFAIEAFIHQLSSEWSDEAMEIIERHDAGDGHFSMSRELAVIVEQAKQHFLWVRAGVVTNNEKVIDQLDANTVARIRQSETEIQAALASGVVNPLAVEARVDRVIASEEVEVGGGCAGESVRNFRDSDGPEGGAAEGAFALFRRRGKREKWKLKKGVCVVASCPSRIRRKEVELGPCGVCMNRCQKMYDKNDDPTKKATVRSSKTPRRVGAVATKQNERRQAKPEQPAYKSSIERKRGEPLRISTPNRSPTGEQHRRPSPSTHARTIGRQATAAVAA